MADDRISPEEFLKKSNARKQAERNGAPVDDRVPEEWVTRVAAALKLAEKGSITPADIKTLIGACGYDLRYNSVLIRPELREVLKVMIDEETGEQVVTWSPWRPMTDGLHARLVDLMRVLGEFAGGRVCRSTLCNRITVDRAITQFFADNAQHPIVEYFAHCVSLTGCRPGAFERLCSHFDDRDGLFPLYLKKWMMGCVARVLKDYQNPTFVMDGEQGFGKSFFFGYLASGLSKEYFQEGRIDPDNKDHRIRLATCWIWCSNEFGETFSRSSQNALKDFQTMETINERPAYGKYTLFLKRLCNIAATTNDKQIFCDPTGNRRYLTTFITRIDHAYATEVNVDELWREIINEVTEAIERGEQPWVLTADEKAQQALVNRTAEKEDVLEDFILDTFEVTGKESDGIIAGRLQSILFERFQAKGQLEENRLRRAADAILEHKLKVRKIRRSNTKIYMGIKER